MQGIIFYVPEAKATEPANGECLVNRWWTVHPEKGVAFYCDKRRPWGLEQGDEDTPSPQCNSSEGVARRIQKTLHADCETRFIPAVYMAHAIREMHAQRKALRSAA